MKRFLLVLFLLVFSNLSYAGDRPNIVLVFMDNFGWGEVGAYGGGIWAENSPEAGTRFYVTLPAEEVKL